MAKLPLSLASTRPYKTKDYSQQPNGISFWAFLVSIFIYISIFYVFNLSPSTLFTTPRFWFFISNTLILIIAADSGAFSSSPKENHQDFYDEYLANSRARNSPSVEVVVEKSITPVQEVENLVENKVVVHETKLELKNDLEKPSESTPEDTSEAYHDKKIEARTIQRSKSDKAISVKAKDEENKTVLRRSETEKLRPSAEENEFLSMSDEELNRRIEEFIQKFNRQIRASRDQY
ncbi:hypothetical protein VitviT2T_015456 [Vitis vinifera]|uniref:DUF4408 domain-containing protein n=2 Tax=Vitis vinifera TaxID=29760 RepID=A0A438HZU0_VITVI|nr:uncharacterized protein LOC104880516 [Vitis vinifera]RVW89942.1 hypothetical protein CK203_036545 [Vitis vinifera]WJZ96809.1 hypothetical protein VitviT2T_015456 [Vitis vinifera]|eukprot:XP_010655680.1 PREDICTED: uncharacterized protein LOC104880516 [Vitis vinifera]